MSKRTKPYWYQKIHLWLNKEFGKATICEGDNCTGKSTRFHYALKKGKKYEFKRSSFLTLCVSCHTKYDFTAEKRANISKGKKGVPAKNKIPVLQLDIDGNLINKFDSITEASKATKIGLGSIGNCLTNKTKTSGGYKWAYVH